MYFMFLCQISFAVFIVQLVPKGQDPRTGISHREGGEGGGTRVMPGTIAGGVVSENLVDAWRSTGDSVVNGGNNHDVHQAAQHTSPPQQQQQQQQRVAEPADEGSHDALRRRQQQEQQEQEKMERERAQQQLRQQQMEQQQRQQQLQQQQQSAAMASTPPPTVTSPSQGTLSGITLQRQDGGEIANQGAAAAPLTDNAWGQAAEQLEAKKGLMEIQVRTVMLFNYM